MAQAWSSGTVRDDLARPARCRMSGVQLLATGGHAVDLRARRMRRNVRHLRDARTVSALRGGLCLDGMPRVSQGVGAPRVVPTCCSLTRMP